MDGSVITQKAAQISLFVGKNRKALRKTIITPVFFVQTGLFFG